MKKLDDYNLILIFQLNHHFINIPGDIHRSISTSDLYSFLINIHLLGYCRPVRIKL
jgi:hypothetical protein